MVSPGAALPSAALMVAQEVTVVWQSALSLPPGVTYHKAAALVGVEWKASATRGSSPVKRAIMASLRRPVMGGSPLIRRLPRCAWTDNRLETLSKTDVLLPKTANLNGGAR